MSTQPPVTFASLGLADALVRAVDETGYEAPSSIQAAAIPPLLEGRDLLGQAQTGTGKTAAFALPLLSRLDLSRRHPQILVLAPTRELAIQVAEAMQTYARYLPGFHVLPVYGGQGMDTQLRSLRRGVHAVVGTPGRVADHLRRGTLRLDGLKAVVLDEADEMLRMGFIDEVTGILEQTPANKQVALFSATMPSAIARIARSHLRDPADIHIESKTTTVAAVTQRYWEVSGGHKLDALTRILEVEDFDGMLVFVRTRNLTVELAEKLEARGYASAALNGDMHQQLRERTVERLKKGAIDILVATDVAARGLDVERISHVINYDIPYDTEAYVHRIGRTARAGRSGDAILFVAPRERRMLRSIEHATGQPILHMRMPTSEDISDRRTTRFKQLITDTMAAQDLSFLSTVIADYQLEHNVAAEDVAAALAWLAQREKPLRPPGAPAAPTRRTSESSASSERQRPERVPVAATAPRPPKPAPERKTRPPRENAPAIVADTLSAAATPSEPDAVAGMHAAPTSGEPRQILDQRRRSGVKPKIETLLRYRIAVGSTHGAEARHIVGAIANESGLDSEFIGRVRIGETHSTVELPEGMPKVIFKHLKKVWVCGQQLKIEADNGEDADMRPARETLPQTRPEPGEAGGAEERPSSAGFDKRAPESRPSARPAKERSSAKQGPGARRGSDRAGGGRSWPQDPSRSARSRPAPQETPATGTPPVPADAGGEPEARKPFRERGASRRDSAKPGRPLTKPGAAPKSSAPFRGAGKPGKPAGRAATSHTTPAGKRSSAASAKPTTARKPTLSRPASTAKPDTGAAKPTVRAGRPGVARKPAAGRKRPPKPS